MVFVTFGDFGAPEGRQLGEPEAAPNNAVPIKLLSKNPSKQSLVREKSEFISKLSQRDPN